MAQKETKKPKKAKVNYKPNVRRMVALQATTAAKTVEAVQRVDLERKVVRMVVRGRDYESVSRRIGVTTNEVHRIVQEQCKTWIGELSHSGPELREIAVQQINAALALATYQAFPHPMQDDYGRPVMVRNCDCALEEGVTKCDIPGHMQQAITQPSKQWLDVAMSIHDRKAKLLGLDAAQKIEQQKVDMLERIYTGVDAKIIEKL